MEEIATHTAEEPNGVLDEAIKGLLLPFDPTDCCSDYCPIHGKLREEKDEDYFPTYAPYFLARTAHEEVQEPPPGVGPSVHALLKKALSEEVPFSPDMIQEGTA